RVVDFCATLARDSGAQLVERRAALWNGRNGAHGVRQRPIEANVHRPPPTRVSVSEFLQSKLCLSGACSTEYAKAMRLQIESSRPRSKSARQPGEMLSRHLANGVHAWNNIHQISEELVDIAGVRV